MIEEEYTKLVFTKAEFNLIINCRSKTKQNKITFYLLSSF